LTENDILKLAVESGIISLPTIRASVEEMQRKRILNTIHKHEIWQGSNEYWYTYLDYPTGRKLIKRKARESIENIIVEFYDGECKNPTLQMCFLQWVTEKLNHGEIQRQSYDRYSADFDRFFEEFGKRKIKLIDEDDLYTFIKDSIHDYGLTAKAFAGIRTILLGTFKYAKRKKYTKLSITEFFGDLDISRGIYKRRKFTDQESVFTDNEVKSIYEVIEREPINILSLGVKLALETGIRGGELSVLKYSDLQGNVLNVSKTEIKYKDGEKFVYEVRESTKGKYDARMVVLLPQTVELIEQIHRMNPNGEYLFEKDGKRIIAKCFTGRLKRICKHADITPRSLHKARKTYVTKLANAGVPQKVICSQVGHTDFTTTTNYYWFNNQDTQQVQNYIERAMSNHF